MKRLYLFVVVFLLSALPVLSQTIMDGAGVVSDLTISHDADEMTVSLTFDLSSLHLKRNRELFLTPLFSNDDDECALPSLRIMGRRRYVYNRRNHIVGRDDANTFRMSKNLIIDYTATTPYEEWMSSYLFSIANDECGCCTKLLAQGVDLLAEYVPYYPAVLYVQPVAEKKTRAIEGSAYIDFVVNHTDIDPSYRRNPVELAKINATIDSVRGDADVTITNIWLKGFASPESPYEHNTELAIGRVAALKDYVQGLYHLADSMFTTAYEPEDWEGLRRYVAASSLPHRQQILALIDDTTLSDLDAKEWKLKSTYPADYKLLFDDCYPALRHTDYRISYVIREFTDIEVIRALLASDPGKLSLNEIYHYALTLTPGSDEFNSTFATAAHLFPNDAVANLNAANAAIEREDYTSAETFLAKAGDSAEAEYARGIYYYYTGDLDAAAVHLSAAAAAGVPAAAEVLEHI